jgi:ketosteroid isomerase-like protein
MANDDGARVTVERFHEAFIRHDIAALAQLITEDCVFEDTAPPDGVQYVGRDAVLEAWRGFFAQSAEAHFDVEEIITAGDRVVVPWRYRWAGGHVRGVDLMLVHDGRVAESLAYVKG